MDAGGNSIAVVTLIVAMIAAIIAALAAWYAGSQADAAKRSARAADSQAKAANRQVELTEVQVAAAAAALLRNRVADFHGERKRLADFAVEVEELGKAALEMLMHLGEEDLDAGPPPVLLEAQSKLKSMREFIMSRTIDRAGADALQSRNNLLPKLAVLENAIGLAIRAYQPAGVPRTEHWLRTRRARVSQTRADLQGPCHQVQMAALDLTLMIELDLSSISTEIRRLEEISDGRTLAK